MWQNNLNIKELSKETIIRNPKRVGFSATCRVYDVVFNILVEFADPSSGGLVDYNCGLGSWSGFQALGVGSLRAVIQGLGVQRLRVWHLQFGSFRK